MHTCRYYYVNELNYLWYFITCVLVRYPQEHTHACHYLVRYTHVTSCTLIHACTYYYVNYLWYFYNSVLVRYPQEHTHACHYLVRYTHVTSCTLIHACTYYYVNYLWYFYNTCLGQVSSGTHTCMPLWSGTHTHAIIWSGTHMYPQVNSHGYVNELNFFGVFL